MTGLFDEVWDIRTMGFQPKPDPGAYRCVVAAAGLTCEQAAMFDDLPHNLAPARAMGMTTIKVDSPGHALTELGTVLGVALLD